jgi:hypothetical protein
MSTKVEATREFRGPCWVTIALLEIEPAAMVEEVLRDLPARVTASTTVMRATHVELGPLVRTGREGKVAFELHDAAHPAVFPRLHGEFRVLEAGEARTALTVTGEYDVPLGVVGDVGDRIAGHRLAQNTMDEVTERLARRMEAKVAEHPGWSPSDA